MGTDINTVVEIQNSEGDWKVFEEPVFGGRSTGPFRWRDYGLFGFLANVRNYSFVPPLGLPKYELPATVSEEVERDWNDDEPYDTSWYTVKELIAFDYDQTFEDRRAEKQIGPNRYDGAADAGIGNGKIVTFREFLGSEYFQDLETLQGLGKPPKVRVIFWFS